METLAVGSHGDAVKKLQNQLNAHGAKLKEDGAFGPATEAAVREFQQKNNLTVDGLVGEHTNAALNK